MEKLALGLYAGSFSLSGSQDVMLVVNGVEGEYQTYGGFQQRVSLGSRM